MTRLRVRSNFVGGAAGSAAAGALWAAGGWTAITIAGVGTIAATLVVWAISRTSLGTAVELETSS
ncbi:hypothetical protein ACSBPH_04300 [Microbacterium sp. F51-2R]|uniref:hypothetical protein n=1 Tax=Microbacterium sp. F51-2R TaxID=3445777 RepID=UPI003F9EF1F6